MNTDLRNNLGGNRQGDRLGAGRIVSYGAHETNLRVTFKNENAYTGPPSSESKKNVPQMGRPIGSHTSSVSRGANRHTIDNPDSRNSWNQYTPGRSVSLLPKPELPNRISSRGRPPVRGLSRPLNATNHTTHEARNPVNSTFPNHNGQQARPFRPEDRSGFSSDSTRDPRFRSNRSVNGRGSQAYEFNHRPPYRGNTNRPFAKHHVDENTRPTNVFQRLGYRQSESCGDPQQYDAPRQRTYMRPRRARGVFVFGNSRPRNLTSSRSSQNYWQHDNRQPSPTSNQLNTRNYASPRSKTSELLDAPAPDEYIDDFTPEDLAKYKLEINMDSFTVRSPTLSDPILTTPLSKWLSDELRYVPDAISGACLKASGVEPLHPIVDEPPTSTWIVDRCSPEGTDDGKHMSQRLSREGTNYLSPAFQLWTDCGLSTEPQLRRASVSGGLSSGIDFARLYPVRTWPCLKTCEPEPPSETSSDSQDGRPFRSYSPLPVTTQLSELFPVPSRNYHSLQDLGGSDDVPIQRDHKNSRTVLSTS